MRIAHQTVSRCLLAVATFVAFSALVRAQGRTEVTIQSQPQPSNQPQGSPAPSGPLQQRMSRFAVEWLVPAQPDRLIHVMLLDRDRPAPYVFAVGHGADKVHALLNLWNALKQNDAGAEAMDYVGAEYKRRTGSAIFYEFYTEKEKKEQRTKSNTGLFFFRGKPGAPFAVIAPGGGFSYVGSVHEGFPYAVAISKQGYNAFVLRYRAGAGGEVATRDLAAAVSYIVRNAKGLGVGIEGCSLWGSSAGARMAAAIGSHGAAKFGGDDLPKPSAVVMAYTGHSEYSAHEPPTFVVVGEQDGIAPPSVMEKRVAALRGAGTEVEFHRYSGLGHGFGAGIGTTAEGWLDRAVRFWETIIKPSIRR